MRPFRSVSASQIDAFKSCKRLWYYGSILGIRGPQHPAAALGTELHDFNEVYLKTGQKPKPGTEAASLFYAGLAHLPPPLVVKAEIVLEDTHVPGFDLAGLKVRGKIDQTDLRGEEPAITDYKTASSARFILTEDDLRKDPQLSIYAHYTRLMLPTLGLQEPQGVYVSHLVYFTKNKNIVKRTGPVRLDRKHLDSQWEVLTGIVNKMKEVAVTPSVDLVEPTLSSCSKYNGCFFQPTCTAYKAVSGNKSMFDGIENNKASTGTDDYSSEYALGGLASQRGEVTSVFAGFDSFPRSGGVDNAGLDTSNRPRLNIPPPVMETIVMMNPLDALALLKAKNAANVAAASGTAPAPIAVQAPAPAPTVAPVVQQAAPQGVALSALAALQARSAAAVAAAGGATSKPANGLLSADAPPQVAPASSTLINVQPAPAVVVAPVVETPVVAAEAPVVVPVVVATAPAAAPVAEQEEAPVAGQVHQRRPKGYVSKLSALGYTAAEIETFGADKMHDLIDGNIRSGSAQQALTVVSTPAVVAEVAPAVVAEVVAPVVVEVVAEAVAPAVEVVETKAEAAPVVAAKPAIEIPKPKTVAGLVLYIDCAPQKVSAPFAVTRLEEILAPYMAEVAKGGIKGDGSVPLTHYTQITYGDGTARVIALMLKNPPTGAVLVDTRYPISNAALEVLTSMSSDIYRGLR